jgi:hypothetical protein
MEHHNQAVPPQTKAQGGHVSKHNGKTSHRKLKGREERGEGGGQGVEMTQTMYAHVNK